MGQMALPSLHGSDDGGLANLFLPPEDSENLVDYGDFDRGELEGGEQNDEGGSEGGGNANPDAAQVQLTPTPPPLAQGI